MKTIFKYIFASIFVGLCAVGYQAVFYNHNARSSDIVSSSAKPNNLKNSNPSPSRASRIAKLEKQALQGADMHVDIPVRYEMMPGQAGHIPVKKSTSEMQVLDKTQEKVQNSKSNGQPFFARNVAPAHVDDRLPSDNESHHPEIHDPVGRNHTKTSENHVRKNQDNAQSTSAKPTMFYDIKRDTTSDVAHSEPKKDKEPQRTKKSLKQDKPLPVNDSQDFEEEQPEEKQEVKEKKPSWLRRLFSWVPAGIIPVAIQQAFNKFWSKKPELNTDQNQQEQSEHDNTDDNQYSEFTSNLDETMNQMNAESMPPPTGSMPAPNLGQSPAAQPKGQSKGFVSASADNVQTPNLQRSTPDVKPVPPAAHRPAVQPGVARNVLPEMKNMSQPARRAPLNPQATSGLSMPTESTPPPTGSMPAESTPAPNLGPSPAAQPQGQSKGIASASVGNVQAPKRLQTSAPGVRPAQPAAHRPAVQPGIARNVLPEMQNMSQPVRRAPLNSNNVQELNPQVTSELLVPAQPASQLESGTQQAVLPKKSSVNVTMNAQAPRRLQTSARASGEQSALPAEYRPAAQPGIARNVVPVMQNATQNIARKSLPADGTAQELNLAVQEVDPSLVQLPNQTPNASTPLISVNTLYNLVWATRLGLQLGLGVHAVNQGYNNGSGSTPGTFADPGIINPPSVSSQQADALLPINQPVRAQDTGVFARVQTAGTALANAAKSVKVLP